MHFLVSKVACNQQLIDPIFTRPKLCGPRLGVGSQVIVVEVVVVVVIIQTSRKSLGFQKPSSST